MDKNGSNQSVMLFEYESTEVRTVVIDDEVWFVAKDVCDILGLDNPTEAIRPLDEDEKNTLRISEGNRGNPNVNIISESGVYALVFRSNKPEAKAFSRWVRHEVLPQIRRTGSYRVNSDSRAMWELRAEKSNLSERRRFWQSLFKAYKSVSEELSKATKNHNYPISHKSESEDERNIRLLGIILSAAETLIQGRIDALERKENMLSCILTE